MLSLYVQLDTKPLADALNRLPGLLDCRRGPMHDAMAQASRRLMEFEHREFVQNSGGGGGWPQLAPSTIAARLRKQMNAAGSRRQSRSGGKSLTALVANAVLPMLSVTGTLEAGLFDPNGPGHFQRFDGDSVSEGVEGGNHPDFKGGVSALALIHQFGGGHVPARPEYVPPDGQALQLIGAELRKGLADAIASIAQGGTPPAAAAAGTP